MDPNAFLCVVSEKCSLERKESWVKVMAGIHDGNRPIS